MQSMTTLRAGGASSSLKTALNIVRPAGWITKVGWGPQPLDGSLDALVQKNVRLQGSFSHNWPIWERVLQLLDEGRDGQVILTAPKKGDIPIRGGALEEWKIADGVLDTGS